MGCRIPRLRFKSFLKILVSYAVTTILGITLLANVQYEVRVPPYLIHILVFTHYKPGLLGIEHFPSTYLEALGSTWKMD